MDGFVNILKPPGMTSHDAVAYARRLFGQRRIGHGGTLDPGAAGVLPLCLGRATRLADVILDMPKEYRAEMTLGVSTDTHDSFGSTVRVATDCRVSPLALGEACSRFLGVYEQVPPMTSALRHRGRRLYDLAREGHVVPREARPVTIYSIHIVRVIPDDPFELGFGTRVFLDVACSKGTYVRTLCHDIGEMLGCGAHMSFLIRTRVGPFHIGDALTWEQLEALAAENRLAEAVLPPAFAVEHLPAVTVDAGQARRFGQGAPVAWTAAPGGGPFASAEVKGDALTAEGLVRVHGPDGRLVGLGRWEAGGGRRWLRPERVLQPPEAGAAGDAGGERASGGTGKGRLPKPGPGAGRRFPGGEADRGRPRGGERDR